MHGSGTSAADLTVATGQALLAAVQAWSGRSPAAMGLDAAGEALAPVRPPRPEMGDLSLPCFPLARPLQVNPAQAAAALVAPAQEALARAAETGAIPRVARVTAAGPYLNLVFDAGSLCGWVCERIAAGESPFGGPLPATGRRTMVEYSAPNTNKPLHLGHVRNNLLGMSLCRILAAAGDEVIPVNLVNDRGVHIAKSMVAYERWGEGRTPETIGRKGDHFVGDFYVRFNQTLREETERLAQAEGIEVATLDEDGLHRLEDRTPLMTAARESLRRWEEGDPATRRLWETMNRWVYAGFDETYARLGCAFRKWYFESETYQRGKGLVEEGLARGLFEKRADGSVWADLEAEGLKEKLLTRSDGTSVYITQDLGTAALKFDEFHMDRSVYVVGSEQNLHFQMLFALLRRLGMPWAGGCRHLSYGLVTLPHGMGKLKSREGKAVDADDLLDELAGMAKRKAQDGGYVTDLDLDLVSLADAIGQGALKMYLLQVSAEKNIQFDPDATLDFEGDTGPAVQYSHARICSIVRKALAEGRIAPEDLRAVEVPDPFTALGTGSPVRAVRRGPATEGVGAAPSERSMAALARVRSAAGLQPERADASRLERPEEKALALDLSRFPNVLRQAADQLSPSPVAGYLLELTKSYARFYHNCPVLRAETDDLTRARLHLCLAVAATLRRGLGLLGIHAPEAM